MTEVKGHCLCGKTTYTFTSKTPKLDSAICHCNNCQRFSGAAFSLLIGVDKNEFKVSGPVKQYKDTGSSGKQSIKHFCGECGSSIARQPQLYDPTLFVCGGTINDELKQHIRAPSLELYTSSKLHFITQTAPDSHTEA